MKFVAKYFTSKLIVLLFSVIFLSGYIDSNAEKPRKSNRLLKPLDSDTKIIFPDEYTILDEENQDEQPVNEHLLSAIEDSRQNYFQALILIQKKDTLAAAHYFEKAIDKLNLITSYPGIEKNEEFTDLAQSIIEDYESFINSVEYLDEQSPMFIVHEMLYKDIEALELAELSESNDSTINSHTFGYTPGFMTPPDNLEIEMTDNEFVNISMKFWQTEKYKKIFEKWLERSSRYYPMMVRIAEAEGVPKELLYLSMIESGLNANAVSRAKAVGLWQFMRSTGKMYGLNADNSPWVDERRDPEKATRAAFRHFRDLYTQFGDWHLAMAAYNCGAGCVSRAIRRSNINNPDFWQVRKFLPDETRKYVPFYIATALVAMNPEYYGFALDSINWQDEYKYDLFEVTSPISLGALAKACNITEEELKELNPELIKNSTPADVDVYYLKIPQGSKELLAANIMLISEEEKTPFTTHKVKRNETLHSIAKQYGTTIDEIVNLNGNIRNRKTKLRIGQELEVPVSSSELRAMNSKKEDTKSNNPIVANADEDVTHTVKKGESLYSIARRYGVRISDIRNYNNIPYNDDNLESGRTLIIAKKANTKNEIANGNTQKTHSTTHKVKRGESLGSISELYGTSVSKLKSINGLSRNTIYPGQKLKIETTVNTESIKSSTSNSQTSVHKVSRGETLGTIAAMYGLTEKELKEMNPSEIKGNTVYFGSRLKVREVQDQKGASTTKDDVKNAPVYYTIRRGDTLFSIADKFGVSVKIIENLNSSLNPRKLQVGKKIRIK